MSLRVFPTAAAGTFARKRELAMSLAAAMIRWEGVPKISLFLDNTAAFVVSQDGTVSFFWQQDGRVLMKRNVNTSNPNLGE